MPNVETKAEELRNFVHRSFLLVSYFPGFSSTPCSKDFIQASQFLFRATGNYLYNPDICNPRHMQLKSIMEIVKKTPLFGYSLSLKESLLLWLLEISKKHGIESLHSTVYPLDEKEIAIFASFFPDDPQLFFQSFHVFFKPYDGRYKMLYALFHFLQQGRWKYFPADLILAFKVCLINPHFSQIWFLMEYILEFPPYSMFHEEILDRISEYYCYHPIGQDGKSWKTEFCLERIPFERIVGKRRFSLKSILTMGEPELLYQGCIRFHLENDLKEDWFRSTDIDWKFYHSQAISLKKHPILITTFRDDHYAERFYLGVSNSQQAKIIAKMQAMFSGSPSDRVCITFVFHFEDSFIFPIYESEIYSKFWASHAIIEKMSALLQRFRSQEGLELCKVEVLIGFPDIPIYSFSLMEILLKADMIFFKKILTKASEGGYGNIPFLFYKIPKFISFDNKQSPYLMFFTTNRMERETSQAFPSQTGELR